MYKFVDGSGGCYSAAAGWTAATWGTGTGTWHRLWLRLRRRSRRKLSADVVNKHWQTRRSAYSTRYWALYSSTLQPYQSTLNSINTNPITGANVIELTNTLYGIVTDNSALMVAAKYTWDPFKFYGGYRHHIQQNNPLESAGCFGASDQGGYFLSGVTETTILTLPETVQIWWTGVKYAYGSHTDITLSFYQQRQATFRVPPTCVPGPMRASCAGTVSEASLYVDHHFLTAA